jgi:hypothetical protein
MTGGAMIRLDIDEWRILVKASLRVAEAGSERAAIGIPARTRRKRF